MRALINYLLFILVSWGLSQTLHGIIVEGDDSGLRYGIAGIGVGIWFTFFADVWHER